MAIGWEDLQRVKRVEAKADELGFVFKSGDYTRGGEGTGAIYVKPKDDSLPHYSRDTYFFSGSLEAIDHWLQGIECARNYDQVIKLSDPKKRAAKEQVERFKQLMRTIKTGKLAKGTMSGTQIIDLSKQVSDIVIDYGNNDFADYADMIKSDLNITI